MQEESLVSAIDQLGNMSPEDIRNRLAPVLLEGEVLSDDDCEQIRVYAEGQLEKDARLSLDDIFMKAAAVRLDMHGLEKGQYTAVDTDGIVVAYGSDPKGTAQVGHKNLTGI